MMLRTSAAVMTVIAAALVAANWNARSWSRDLLSSSSAPLAWMIDGWLESKASLVIQNGVLLLINVLGVWRWLPKPRTICASLQLASEPHPEPGGLADIGTLCRANSKSIRHRRALRSCHSGSIDEGGARSLGREQQSFSSGFCERVERQQGHCGGDGEARYCSAATGGV